MPACARGYNALSKTARFLYWVCAPLSNEPQRARANLFSHDRRRFARRRLNSLAYIDLGNDNGGIVLNVGEGGLAVHSAVALNARFLPSIRFQLPHSAEWVSARGDITWIDGSRKQAGIRFGALSDSARSQIHGWIASSSDAGSPDEFSVGETMQLASITLGTIPVPRKAAPSAEAEGAREIESVDRKLRVHFARRDSAPERKTRSERGMWWSFIATICLLAILSFGFGWITGHGRMGVISTVVANVRAHIVAYAQNRTASAAITRTRAHSAISPASAASPSAVPPPAPVTPTVTVTTQAYVPVSNDAQNAPEKIQQLLIGRIVQRVDPAYPPQAISQHIEGTVHLRATVAVDGTVQAITAISGNPVLASPAEAAVRQWHFAPTVLDATPVSTEQAITIAFSLSSAR